MGKKGKIKGMDALEPLAVMGAGAIGGAVFGTAINSMLSPEAGYGPPKNGVIDMTTAANKALPMTQTPMGVFGIKALLGLGLLYGASETTEEASQVLAGLGFGLLGQGTAQFVVQKTNENGTESGFWTNQGKISGTHYKVGCGCNSKMEGVYRPYFYDNPSNDQINNQVKNGI
jgi:ABC-type uncharacterized transport system permease subunit